MKKMITAALGSLSKRPESNEENGRLGQEHPERPCPSVR